MATPTLTTLTGSNIPYNATAATRITGGSTTDRIAITDLVTAISEWTRDAVTGVVTQSTTTGTVYLFGGDSETAAKDCFVELDNVVFQLYSNEGTDTSSTDLGNGTSKVIFANQCDVVIGTDTGFDGGFNGNVTIRGENYGYNFFNFIPIFERQTLVTCHSFLVMSGRGNTRVALINSNNASDIKFVAAGHTADVAAERVQIAVDVSGTLDLVVYSDNIALRENLIPGGLLSDTTTITQAITNDDEIQIYFNSLADLSNRFIIQDLQVSSVSQTLQPLLKIVYNRTATVDIFLRRFGSSRDDNLTAIASNSGNMRVHLQKDVIFTIADSAGISRTADLQVENSTLATTFPSGEDQAPSGTVTQFGESNSYTGVSTQTVAVTDKTIICSNVSDLAGYTPSDTPVAGFSRNRIRYSAWSFGYQVIYRTEQVLTGNNGTENTLIQLNDETNLTSATSAAVPTTASTFDNVFDMIYKWAIDNTNELPFSASLGTIDFGSSDVVLSTSATAVSVSDEGEITVPVSSTLSEGSTITALLTTGTITRTGVTINGRITDTNGTPSIVTLVADDGDTVGFFQEDGTQIAVETLDGSNSFVVELTPAQSLPGQIMLVAKAGYTPKTRNASTEDGGVFRFSVSSLRRIDGPDGAWLYDSEATSSFVSTSFDVSDIDDVQCRINIGNSQIRATNAFTAFSDVVTSADGLKYLAFDGEMLGMLLDPVNGDNLYLPSMMKLKRAASGDSNAGILATVYHVDNTPVDDDNGEVQLVGGRVLDDFAQALLVDTDIDFDQAGIQSVASTLVGVRNTGSDTFDLTEDMKRGLGAGMNVLILKVSDTDYDILDGIEPGTVLSFNNDPDNTSSSPRNLEVFDVHLDGVNNTVRLYFVGDSDVLSINTRFEITLEGDSVDVTQANRVLADSAVASEGQWFVGLTYAPTAFAPLTSSIGVLQFMRKALLLARDHSRAANTQTQSSE